MKLFYSDEKPDFKETHNRLSKGYGTANPEKIGGFSGTFAFTLSDIYLSDKLEQLVLTNPELITQLMNLIKRYKEDDFGDVTIREKGNNIAERYMFGNNAWLVARYDTPFGRVIFESFLNASLFYLDKEDICQAKQSLVDIENRLTLSPIKRGEVNMNEKEYDHALVLKAIKFAAESHCGVIRKGTENNPIPYIVHPMESAAIVSSMTNDSNVIAAALLHDVVEDAKVSVETLEGEFNEVVAKLVAAESEDKREDLPSSETWKIRKWETIEHLNNLGSIKTDKNFSLYVKMLTLADKLSNIRAMKADYAKHGDKLWERFNQKDPEMQAWYYRSLKEALNELQEHEAWKEYDRLVEEVFCNHKKHKSYIYPMVDRSNADFSDPDDKNIGYAKGILSDGRPYLMECWAADHSTYLTFFVSTVGIEHYSSDQVVNFIEKEGLFRRLKKDVIGSAVLWIDSNENEFWSTTLIVGDEEDTYIDSIPLKKWEY